MTGCQRVTQFGWFAVTALVGCMMLTGCQAFRLPKLPESIKKPTTQVVGVQLIEQGPDAARFAISVTLDNPNDQPLPLQEARYNLHIEGLGAYKGQTDPNAVIPASSQQTIVLNAVIDVPAGDAVGRDYRVGGSVMYHPPGEMRNISYDVGVPLPSATFVGNGSVVSAVVPTPEPTIPKTDE